MRDKRYGIYFRGAWKKLAVLSAGGLLAGFCNGLLGAGGGIILVFTLGALVGEDSEARRSIYANALAVMLPLSIFTLMRYAGSGSLTERSAGLEPIYILGAAAGGVAGGILLGRLRGRNLKRLFALLTLISGILMIVR